jgi:hypothetical protein
MQAVRRLVQEHYYTIVMLLLVGGFAILLAELLMLGHTDGVQLVGVGATVAGLILTLAALFVRERAAMAVAVMLVLLSVTGLIGVREHLEQREADGAERAAIQQPQQAAFREIAYTQDDDDAPKATAPDGNARPDGDRDDNGGTPPPLAPLSLAGLSIMGAVTIVGASRKEA